MRQISRHTSLSTVYERGKRVYVQATLSRQPPTMGNLLRDGKKRQQIVHLPGAWTEALRHRGIGVNLCTAPVSFCVRLPHHARNVQRLETLRRACTTLHAAYQFHKSAIRSALEYAAMAMLLRAPRRSSPLSVPPTKKQ